MNEYLEVLFQIICILLLALFAVVLFIGILEI